MTSPEKPVAEVPPERRPRSILQRANALLTSPKLAIALLVGVLACCVVGVTIFRGARAWELIFATLWFNALLVLLALSSAAAFFTRIWRRTPSLLQAGMILFHLSFLAVVGGVVYNSLFSFRGVLRLTEGETLPNGRPDSYDVIEQGRLFDFRRLRGETSLQKVQLNYRVNGENKRAAYEVSVTDGDTTVQRTIYVTQHLDFGGVRYFCLKEGYSVLVVMSGKDGREIYGAHLPLQSLKQDGGSYLYATGTKDGPGAIAFPQPPEHPRAEMLLTYRPNTVVERAGDVAFQVWPIGAPGDAPERKGTVTVGAEFDAGDFRLAPREIRYWVGMNVRYDPGLNVILASLCLGLAGMVMTLVGRLRQGTARRRPA